MSDPTPTDVPDDVAWATYRVEVLRDSLLTDAAAHGPAVIRGRGFPNHLMSEAQDGLALRTVLDALTALRLDVQRITEERDRALAQSAAEAKQFQEAAEMAGALAEAEADRDAQVREAFLAGRFGRALPSGWTFTEPEYAHNADEAFAAYLRERQDGKEHAK
jgi:hypothetical protein